MRRVDEFVGDPETPTVAKRTGFGFVWVNLLEVDEGDGHGKGSLCCLGGVGLRCHSSSTDVSIINHT